MSFSICAVITARNEAHYLQVLLPLLEAQGIEVIIVDNDSTDNSHKLYAEFLGNPIIDIKRIPYRGYYSLFELLETRQKIYRQITHDWIIHHDADEVMEHFRPGLTLYDAIYEADQSGYNILNFNEFVFLPERNENYLNKNFYTNMLQYYFFQPNKNRLNRAWKRACNFVNITSGGHRLAGKGRSIAPNNHILRHYSVLSYEHVKSKYINRIYGKKELSLGWHGNKRNFSEENLIISESSRFLFKLESYTAKDFRTDVPALKHYWQWTTDMQ